MADISRVVLSWIVFVCILTTDLVCLTVLSPVLANLKSVLISFLPTASNLGEWLDMTFTVCMVVVSIGSLVVAILQSVSYSQSDWLSESGMGSI